MLQGNGRAESRYTETPKEKTEKTAEATPMKQPLSFRDRQELRRGIRSISGHATRPIEGLERGYNSEIGERSHKFKLFRRHRSEMRRQKRRLNCVHFEL